MMVKVKLEKELYNRAVQHAEGKGYSSVEEFIAHAVEEALQRESELSESDEEALAQRLQGLGYVE